MDGLFKRLYFDFVGQVLVKDDLEHPNGFQVSKKPHSLQCDHCMQI